MEVTRPSTSPPSKLNSNAPIFVPSSYHMVEDFSEEWWALVHTSPCFHHYWLQHCFTDPDEDRIYDSAPALLDIDNLFDAFDGSDDASLFHNNTPDHYQTTNNKNHKIVKVKRGRKALVPVVETMTWQKPPKIFKVRVSPCPIQQPR